MHKNRPTKWSQFYDFEKPNNCFTCHETYALAQTMFKKYLLLCACAQVNVKRFVNIVIREKEMKNKTELSRIRKFAL